MEDTLECYKVLEVEPGASPERIRHSYVELARVWDPDRYLDNPELRARAEKKRKEIDDAYHALRVFLPELQGPSGSRTSIPEQDRDFTEMEREAPMESTRAIMGIIAGVIFLLIFVWAFYLLMKGRSVNVPTPLPVE